MKRVYHIVFKEHYTDHMSKGKNYVAIRANTALTLFQTEYPHSLFIAIYDLNALADIKGTSMIEIPQDINGD